MKDIEYYKNNEVLENKYYQIPQELFVSNLYKDKLNSDSKILYAFLLDRLSLSIKNHWVDENKRIYLIFTREEVQHKLNLSDKTVTKAFKQLGEVKLVEEKRQGLGKPNLIYVGKIQHEEYDENEIKMPTSEEVKEVFVEGSGEYFKDIEEIQETEKLRLQSRKIYDSGSEKITSQESENLRGINTNIIKTNNIKTESINPNSDDDELSRLKQKCRLDDFSGQEKIILEDVVDALFYKENLRVGNVTVTRNKIRERLQLIVKENLVRLVEIYNSTSHVQNKKNYLMICLYNNLGEIHIATEKKCPCSSENELQRNYPSDYWDKFYANFSYEQVVAN